MVSVFHLTWKNADTGSYLPFGWIGVQVFFVISGVVIANSASNATAGQFLRGRFYRLYPAAWIAAILNFCLLMWMPYSTYRAMGIWATDSPTALLNSLTLVGNHFLASANWTLPIELAFYTLVLACLAIFGTAKIGLIARSLVVISAPYLLLLFAAGTALPDLLWIDTRFGIKNMLLLRHGVYFAIGIYFWLYTSQRTLKRIDYVLFAIALVAAALEIWYTCIGSLSDSGREGQSGLAGLGIGALLTFFVLASLVCLSLHKADEWIPSTRMKSAMRTLGLVTYPFYLIHELMGGFVLHHARNVGIDAWVAISISLAVVGIVAYLIVAYAEPACRRLIQQWGVSVMSLAATMKRT